MHGKMFAALPGKSLSFLTVQLPSKDYGNINLDNTPPTPIDKVIDPSNKPAKHSI